MYTKIESCFWDDEKLAPLDDDCKLLGLFFLSCKHRNIVGLYILPSVYVTHRLKWSDHRYNKAFAKLLDIGFIKYDTATEILFVSNFLNPRYNPLENPNQVKAAIEKINELPLTPLFGDLIAALQKHYKPFHEPLIKRLQERLFQGYGKQETVTVTVTEEVKETVPLITNLGDNTPPVVSSVDNFAGGNENNEVPPPDAAFQEVIKKGGNTTKAAEWSHPLVGWAAEKCGGAAALARSPEKDIAFYRNVYIDEYIRLCDLKNFSYKSGAG